MQIRDIYSKNHIFKIQKLKNFETKLFIINF